VKKPEKKEEKKKEWRNI